MEQFKKLLPLVFRYIFDAFTVSEDSDGKSGWKHVELKLSGDALVREVRVVSLKHINFYCWAWLLML
jgi:hypothetical protein